MTEPAPLKVFMVEVTVTHMVPVVAADRNEAQAVALCHYEEDDEQDEDARAYELKTLLPDLRGVIPWGVADKDPRRDWTLEKWLEETK